MNRKMALPYVSFVLDDLPSELDRAGLRSDARLVGWQCGFEPLFVAVQSTIPGVRLDGADAEDIAREFLEARDWFEDHESGEGDEDGDRHAADYVI